MRQLLQVIRQAAAVLLLATFDAGTPAAAQSVGPAVDGLFQAFERHPLVGLGDRHNLAEGHLLYEALVSDPRFGREVGNVVVEFGGARHQDVIDRYVAGEEVPYTTLRQVWTDVVGWVPTVLGAYFAHFFYQVRETNRGLPAGQRIKVWLGEPPIDWSTVHDREALNAIGRNRDRHAAELIVEQILSKKRRALVIYGAYHFEPRDPAEDQVLQRWAKSDPATVRALPRNLQKIVEDTHPGAFFVAQVYTGFGDAECTRATERHFAAWPVPALATPVAGTPLEAELRKCLPKRVPDPARKVPESYPDFVKAYASSHVDDHVLFRGQGLLYLGPSDSLNFAPRLQDAWLDEDYRREIARRLKIMTGQDAPAGYGRNLPQSMRFTQRDHADGSTR